MKNIVLLILFSMFLCFCNTQKVNEASSSNENDTASVVIQDIASNKQMYQAYCGGCHGRKINTFVDRNWIYGSDKESIIHSIKVGYESEGMPAYGESFTDETIASLADFILKSVENHNDQPNPDYDKTYQTQHYNIKLDTIATGLHIPWGMEFLLDGSLLVSEREGQLFKIKNNVKTEVTGLPEIKAFGQGGLMDIKVHPNYQENGWIYFSYTKGNDNNGKTTAIFRAQLEEHTLINVEEIFEALPYYDTKYHFGSKIVFDDDGYLFFSVGDRGKRDINPQSLENHCGKIHRLNEDGSIPEDNPFVKDDTAKHSIYSYGHRNPQGLDKNPVTGEIWETEHGPKGGDEINLIQPGLNYGWPVISYGINYNGSTFTELTHKTGMEQPVFQWTPSIAPCGMAFVRGNAYPAWKGDILSGSLSFEYLHRTKIVDGKVVEEEKLFEDIGRCRNIKMGLDGYLYLAIEKPGYIFRLRPL